MGKLSVERRIEALEMAQGRYRRLCEQIAGIDITEHIADVYKPLHADVVEGKHTFYNLPGGRGSGTARKLPSAGGASQ